MCYTTTLQGAYHNVIMVRLQVQHLLLGCQLLALPLLLIPPQALLLVLLL
jgi:hypothetical protein